MSRALYLLGAPGVGKSTLLGALLEGWDVSSTPSRLTPELMFGHHMIREGQHPEAGDFEWGVYLGVLRPSFPGTDALGMRVMPHAVEWATSGQLPDVIYGEGARLGTPKFLVPLAHRAEVTVAVLYASDEALAARRAARGSDQNEVWMRGARTRAFNAAARCEEAGLYVVTLDAERPLPELVGAVREVFGT